MNYKIILLFMVVIFLSCKKDETTKLPFDCGCESETSFTVPSDNLPEVPIDEQTSGVLFYKRAENVDDVFDNHQEGVYDNHFWVVQGTEGCYNCQRHFIICNDYFLDSEYDFLKNTNDSIPVHFSGELKRLCVEPFIAYGDYYYTGIKLNSIEQY